jgi:hypothetical protein
MKKQAVQAPRDLKQIKNAQSSAREVSKWARTHNTTHTKSV